MSKPKMPKPKDGWLMYRGGARLAEIYEAKDGWRWRLWARNGRVIAESGEAYKRRAACFNMIVDISCGFGCVFVDTQGATLP